MQREKSDGLTNLLQHYYHALHSDAKNPHGFKSQYLFDITRYYSIWFSKYPDSFLNIENQLLFIRMREKNPKA